jgi:hypothetical protein
MPLSLSGTTGIVTGNIASDAVTTSLILNANVTPAKLSQPMTLATAQNATGTAIDFTGIPSWVKRITVSVNSLSINGADAVIVRVGSGSYETSGYTGAYGTIVGGIVGTSNLTNGFPISLNTASGSSFFGSLTIVNLSGGNWNAFGNFGWGNEDRVSVFGGSITVPGGNIDRVRITTAGGSFVFDGGQVNIMYEG